MKVMRRIYEQNNNNKLKQAIDNVCDKLYRDDDNLRPKNFDLFERTKYDKYTLLEWTSQDDIDLECLEYLVYLLKNEANKIKGIGQINFKVLLFKRGLSTSYFETNIFNISDMNSNVEYHWFKTADFIETVSDIFGYDIYNQIYDLYEYDVRNIKKYFLNDENINEFIRELLDSTYSHLLEDDINQGIFNSEAMIDFFSSVRNIIESNKTELISAILSNKGLKNNVPEEKINDVLTSTFQDNMEKWFYDIISSYFCI